MTKFSDSYLDSNGDFDLPLGLLEKKEATNGTRFYLHIESSDGPKTSKITNAVFLDEVDDVLNSHYLGNPDSACNSDDAGGVHCVD